MFLLLRVDDKLCMVNDISPYLYNVLIESIQQSWFFLEEKRKKKKDKDREINLITLYIAHYTPRKSILNILLDIFKGITFFVGSLILTQVVPRNTFLGHFDHSKWNG